MLTATISSMQQIYKLLGIALGAANKTILQDFKELQQSCCSLHIARALYAQHHCQNCHRMLQSIVQSESELLSLCMGPRAL